ncbi:MAG: hypothetical protein FJ088_13550 [Deltaproteobacteria bacterium]|nr:hypothetical protein [Deltaproteobacteria bacterium]
MKKSSVIAIGSVLIIAFAALVYFGVIHRRGTPADFVPAKSPLLKAPYIAKSIDLSKGVSSEIWDSLNGTTIEMMHQTTVFPWGKSLSSPVTVQAFHNGAEIFFRVAWKDATEDWLVKPGAFSDACAVMFNLEPEFKPSSIVMGTNGSVDIWQWKAFQNHEFWGEHKEKPLHSETFADYHYPFENEEILAVSRTETRSAVSELHASGVATLARKEKQTVSGRGIWKDGAWEVVFSRPLDNDTGMKSVNLKEGTKVNCAFAVWNGSNKDRGSRKSISGWAELSLELKEVAKNL